MDQHYPYPVTEGLRRRGIELAARLCRRPSVVAWPIATTLAFATTNERIMGYFLIPITSPCTILGLCGTLAPPGVHSRNTDGMLTQLLRWMRSPTVTSTAQSRGEFEQHLGPLRRKHAHACRGHVARCRHLDRYTNNMPTRAWAWHPAETPHTGVIVTSSETIRTSADLTNWRLWSDPAKTPVLPTLPHNATGNKTHPRV